MNSHVHFRNFLRNFHNLFYYQFSKITNQVSKHKYRSVLRSHVVSLSTLYLNFNNLISKTNSTSLGLVRFLVDNNELDRLLSFTILIIGFAHTSSDLTDSLYVINLFASQADDTFIGCCCKSFKLTSFEVISWLEIGIDITMNVDGWFVVQNNGTLYQVDCKSFLVSGN